MKQKTLDKELEQVEELRRPIFEIKIGSIDGELYESEKQNATISRKVNKRLAAGLPRTGGFFDSLINFRLSSKIDKIKSMMREHQPKVKLIEESILGCLGSVIVEKNSCLIRSSSIICSLETEISHCQYSVHEYDNFINDIQECDCIVLGELRDLSCSLSFYLEVQSKQGSSKGNFQQLLSPQSFDDSYDQIMINVKSNEANEINMTAAAALGGGRSTVCDAKIGDSSAKMDDCCKVDECYKAVRVHQASSDYKRRSLQLSSISVNGLNLGQNCSGGNLNADQKTTTSSGTSTTHDSKYSISFLHSWTVCDQGVTGSKSSKQSNCMLGAIKSRLQLAAGASSKSSKDEAPLSSTASCRSNGFLSPPLNSKASRPEYRRHRTDSMNSTISNTDRSLSCNSQLTTPAASALASTPAFKPDKSHCDYLDFRYALLFEFLPELKDDFSTHYSDPMFKSLVRHIRKCLRFKEVLNSYLLTIETEQDAKTKLLRRIKRLRCELKTMVVAEDKKGLNVGQPTGKAADPTWDELRHCKSMPISFAKAASYGSLASSLYCNPLLSSADSSSHGAPLNAASSRSGSFYDNDYLSNRLQSIHDKMVLDMVSDADLSCAACPYAVRGFVKGPELPVDVQQSERGTGYSHDESLLQEASVCIEKLRGVQEEERVLTDRLYRVHELVTINIQLDRQIQGGSVSSKL